MIYEEWNNGYSHMTRRTAGNVVLTTWGNVVGTGFSVMVGGETVYDVDSARDGVSFTRMAMAINGIRHRMKSGKPIRR